MVKFYSHGVITQKAYVKIRHNGIFIDLEGDLMEIGCYRLWNKKMQDTPLISFTEENIKRKVLQHDGSVLIELNTK